MKVLTWPDSHHVLMVGMSSTRNSEIDNISNTQIATLFSILSDTTLLHDPSRGTCCRSKCSGCAYLDADGNFLFGEYTSQNNLDSVNCTNNNVGSDDGTFELDVSGWIVPYAKVDVGEKIHISKWSKVLFPSAERKEIEKMEFEKLIGMTKIGSFHVSHAADYVSRLAINALWVTLSPSAGYPRLSSAEIIRAIKGIDGALYDKGGAIDYDSFHRAMTAAASTIASASFGKTADGFLTKDPITTIDYDILTKEELLQMVEDRGMKSTFPKLKRIIIEELRFYDSHGRQGKRHPVKNTLS